jgi:Ca2+-binding RTX toxin-like protein
MTLLVAATFFFFLYQGVAHATLQLLQPNPSVPATFVGKGGYSADGLGEIRPGGTVQAEVPAGSTVVRAYLYGSYFFNSSPDATQRTIDFDGTNVVLDFLPNSEPGPCCQLSTARAEVTGQVASKVGGGGGITDFVINNDPSSLDGVALVVIYANSSSSDGTIAILDGGSKQAGDHVVFDLAGPLDTTIPGFGAQMSLGSGFSSQGGQPGHVCGGSQFSTVNVNTQALTGCAGNFDDGEAANGALLTVGGVGDSLANPTPPDSPPDDDEFYNLLPFLQNGDTQIVIDTTNPSGDDNLFLAVIQFSARVAGTVEICDNGADEDGDGLVDGADDDCAEQYLEESCGFTINGKTDFGTDGNDTLTGTPQSDHLRGGRGKDGLAGLEGPDCLFGQRGKDKITGDDGGDFIRAGRGKDKIKGNDGDDEIRLQDGGDRAKGGPGDDRIKAQGKRRKDRGIDVVNCGSGEDQTIVDRWDKVKKNCERVRVVNP